MVVADAAHVKELATWSVGGSVSVFLPQRPVSGQEAGDALRLKNLVRSAEEELAQLGMRPPDAAELVGHIDQGVLSDPSSPIFHRAGVAFFVAPSLVRTYQLVVDAPMLMTAGERFHLKPLLAGLDHDLRYFVLSVTRGSARLHVGGRDNLDEVQVPGMPASLDDAVLYDDREAILTSHGASQESGGVVAAFHGQGDRFDHLTEDMARYLRMVDRSVRQVIGASEPLILAGSRDIVARYRELSGHQCLAASDVFGNPDTMPPDELHRRAVEIAHTSADDSIDKDVARFHALDGTGMATADPAAIIEAAHQGRVDTIFVASDAQLWGAVEPGGRADPHEHRRPGDEDLFDTSAVEAWLTGATVHVMASTEVPSVTGIAALFRY